MKTRPGLLVLLLTLVTIPAYTQGEKKPRTDADYRSRTLRELTTLQPDYIATNPEYQREGLANLRIVVHADLLPSRVKVRYDGATRPVVENRRNVITAWAKRSAGLEEYYSVPYQTEMLFTEDGESHWLAVRTESLPILQQEFKRGDGVELFLIKMGNAPRYGQPEPVLLVEKFVRQ